MHLLALGVTAFAKCLFKSFVHCFPGFFCLFIDQFLGDLYIFWIHFLRYLYVLQIFSASVWLAFSFP